MTTYQAIDSHDVTEELWDAWSVIQRSVPEYDSPFLCPEFTQTVGTVCRNVKVVVINRGGAPVGFFPFQQKGRNAQAVAGRLSECHAAIVRPNVKWSANEVIRCAGIHSWHFDHLPDSQVEFNRFTWGTQCSPYLDLTEGYVSYRNTMKATGSSLSQVERKTRKLAREVGAIRFEWHQPGSETFESLVAWKTAQHERTRVLQVFKHAWLREMLAALTNVDSSTFAAPLGALYAGETLIAVHLGIRSHNVLHMWFPAYNTDFERYSPGLILLLKLAEQAADRNIVRIDLGPGEERYKQNFKSGDRLVCEGMVSQRVMYSTARGLWYHTKRGIRQSRFRNQLEAPLVATRRLRQWLAFQG